MTALTEHRILELWESGQQAGASQRAVLILAAADPAATVDELASLTLGSRDTRLLKLHQETFGSWVAATADCPSCGHSSRFSVQLEDVLASAAEVSGEPTGDASFDFAAEDFELRFRLPDSRDLARAEAAADLAQARGSLVRDLVLQVLRSGQPATVEELPESVLLALGEDMEARDPMSWIPIDLTCSQCAAQWFPLFDIAQVFWRQVVSRAERLLADVQELAAVFGWSETEIFSVSPARRRFYLENSSTRPDGLEAQA